MVGMVEATQWEYRVGRRETLDDRATDWLNTLGAEGWQLTAVIPRPDWLELVFKRPCRSAREIWQSSA